MPGMMVKYNVPSFLSEDIKQAFVHTVCKSRIFLDRNIKQAVNKRKLPKETTVNERTLYKDPSAPTEHPSSKYPILPTIAAIPQELNLAARRPMSLARARKNCRSANVVSSAKKCVKIPMIIKSSSVGSLGRIDRLHQHVFCGKVNAVIPFHKGQESRVEAI